MRPGDLERRRFLLGATGATLLVGGSTRADEDEDVSPTEDLMREHGVLRRLLLVYREVGRRLEAREVVQAEWIGRSAQIVRAFIEDYHEKDEEEHVFPRFTKAGKLTELVEVLVAQHRAGRKLTQDIQRLANPGALQRGGDRARLLEALRSFVRMYEPHAAREDTVLFPAFPSVIGKKELRRLQQLFEQKEQALPLGNFDKMVAEVASIERAIGIYELAAFTPGP